MDNTYPCIVHCYLLRARDGMPPHPEDTPVKSVTVNSKEEEEKVKKELQEEHPNCWLVETPIT